MSTTHDDIADAEVRVETSRRRLASTFALLQSRLAPASLKREATNKIKQIGTSAARSGIDVVKRNPLTAIGVTAAVIAFVARKPIARLLRRKRPVTDKPHKD